LDDDWKNYAAIRNSYVQRQEDLGVPQGCVLGPLFFIWFINDAAEVVKESEIYFFADDTLISVDGESVEE
jgi:Reverse transcriptase (RNA-dependent DNA polymerase)